MTALVDEHPRLEVECVPRELHIASSTCYQWRRHEKEPCKRLRCAACDRRARHAVPGLADLIA